MVHYILLFTFTIVFPPCMSLWTELPVLDPNQSPESKRDRQSFRNDFTWKDACCLNLPFPLTVLVISPHTLWKHLRMVNRASVPCSGLGCDVSKLPSRAGVGNICAQYPFSAGSPNQAFQQHFAPRARHWQPVLCHIGEWGLVLLEPAGKDTS